MPKGIFESLRNNQDAAARQNQFVYASDDPDNPYTVNPAEIRAMPEWKQLTPEQRREIMGLHVKQLVDSGLDVSKVDENEYLAAWGEAPASKSLFEKLDTPWTELVGGASNADYRSFSDDIYGRIGEFADKHNIGNVGQGAMAFAAGAPIELARQSQTVLGEAGGVAARGLLKAGRMVLPAVAAKFPVVASRFPRLFGKAADTAASVASEVAPEVAPGAAAPVTAALDDAAGYVPPAPGRFAGRLANRPGDTIPEGMRMVPVGGPAPVGGPIPLSASESALSRNMKPIPRDYTGPGPGTAFPDELSPRLGRVNMPPVPGQQPLPYSAEVSGSLRSLPDAAPEIPSMREALARAGVPNRVFPDAAPAPRPTLSPEVPQPGMSPFSRTSEYIRPAAPPPVPAAPKLAKGPIGAKKKSIPGGAPLEEGGLKAKPLTPQSVAAQAGKVDQRTFAPNAGAGKAPVRNGLEAAQSEITEQDRLFADRLLQAKPLSTDRKSLIAEAFRNTRDSATRLMNAVERFFDPTSSLKHSGKKLPQFAEDMDWLRIKMRIHGDAAKKTLADHAAYVVDALKPLKSVDERKALNAIYALKHFGAQAQLDREYGYGVFHRAPQMLRAIEQKLGPEVYNRVNASVEELAHRIDEVGWLSVKDRIPREVFDQWRAKNPYYMFAQPAGETDKLFPGMPSFDEVYSRHLKGRIAFEDLPKLDPVEQFASHHYKRVLGQERDVITKESIARMGIPSSNAEAFAKAIKDPDMAVYEHAGPKGKPMSYAMPKTVVDFLTTADDASANMWANYVAEATGPFRVGALNYNPRFLFSTGAMRDTADALTRAPGYWTPVDKYIGQKVWNPLMKKIGAKGLEESTSDLEYLLNPAMLLKAARTSYHVNFSKASEAIMNDAIKQSMSLYASASRQGALQMGYAYDLAKANLPAHLRTAGESASQAANLPQRMMKFYDDFFRMTQVLRTLPAEYRGLQGAGRMMNASHIPEMKGGDILNVRGVNIDFAMKSDLLRKVDKLSPFLVPMVQSIYQTARFAKAQPMSFAMRSAVLLTAASTMYSELKGRPDKPMDKFPQYDQDRFIFADTGVRKQGNRPVFVPMMFIPEPLQPMWAAIRRGIDIMYTKDPDYRQSLKDNYMANVASSGLGSWVSLGGPIVATAETLVGRSLYKGGGTIEREGDKYLPSEKRAAPGTQNLYRLISEKTGITSPDRLKYLARGWTGTLADTVADAADPLVRDRTSYPDMSIYEESKKPFSISAVPRKILEKTGWLRTGRYSPEGDIAQNTIGKVQMEEKGLIAEIKNWHTIAIQAQDPKVQDEAIQRRQEAIDKLIDASIPYGGPPDINELLKSLTDNIMFEKYAPYGRVLNHVPERQRGYVLKVLQNEESPRQSWSPTSLGR